MKVALWVVRRNRPFAIVEDQELLDIFHDLNNKCVTPSASTVSCDVKEIFHMTRVKVAGRLQVSFTMSRVACGLMLLHLVRVTRESYTLV
jgi:hypothetical protein